MVRGDLVGEAAPHLDVTAKFPTWFTPNGATRFNQPNLRDFFIDEDNRVFEVPRFFGESKVWEESGAKDNEQQLNSRLEKVNERLAELEKMLDELLEEAGASER